ncbi:hypothetical protein CIB48_g11921 [Xylaria polymorpha]|nr:hypothetical protein CIB48_g11921 [Xylaria polymorpha]
MESAAVKSEGLVIPLIDFSSFLNGTPEQRKETAEAILHGFQTAGFIYLKGLPISLEYRKHIFETSAKYFRLPIETKMSHCWTTPEANRGYSAPGREKTTTLIDPADVKKLRDAVPDLKESLEIGREGEPGHPNHWPIEEGELVGFKKIMVDFHDKCKYLHTEVMRAIAVGLGIDEHWFDSFTDVGDNTLRLLHYPEVKKDVFTINPGQALPARLLMPPPSRILAVVNAGDLLARWSNDNIKSTIHRVVEPPSGDGDVYPARYSIAYFCNPNFASHIEAIPGTYEVEKDRKYPGINSGDYLVQRLAATY